MLEAHSWPVRLGVAFVVAMTLIVVLSPLFRAAMPSPSAELVTVAVGILVPKLAIGRD